MADQKKPSPEASAAPASGARIVGIGLLAFGVLMATALAIRVGQTDVEVPESRTQQASARVQDASGPDELPQGDLSRADRGIETLSPELTKALITQDDQEALRTAVQQLRQEQGATTNSAGATTSERSAAEQRAIEEARQRLANAPQPGNPTGTQLVMNPNAMISFQSLTFDFGDIYSTTPVPGEFVFTSAGTEDLIIERVQTTCGCTSANAAELRNSRWAPGEGGAIKFTYTPDQKPGAQAKTVNVFTNSTSNRQVTLTLKANYIPAVKTSAQFANFGRIEAGNIGQSRVIIESRDPDFAFIDFDLGESAEMFTWSYSKLDSVDRNYPSRGQLLIQTKADSPTGPMSRIIGRMVYKAREGDADVQSELSANLQIRGEIVGDIEVNPPLARAPLATPGSAFEHRFVVSSRKGQTFTITELRLIDGPVSGVTHEIKPIEGSNGTSYEVIVRGTAPDRAGGFMGRMDVLTDIPNHGPTPLQFSGVLRAAPPAQN